MKFYFFLLHFLSLKASEELISVNNVKNKNFRKELIKISKKRKHKRRIRKQRRIPKPNIMPTIFENIEFQIYNVIEIEKDAQLSLNMETMPINERDMKHKTNCYISFENRIYICLVIFYILMSIYIFLFLKICISNLDYKFSY